MSLNKEIQKLNKLLEDGAITQEEYQSLKGQLTEASDEIPDNSNLSCYNEVRYEVNSIGDEHNRIFLNNFKVATLTKLNELQGNIIDAGSFICSSVSYAVLSQVSMVIAFLILMFVYLPASMGVLTGSSSVDDLETISFFVSIFAMLSFVFWVLQLSKLNSAGKNLKSQINNLTSISYNDDGKVIIPDPKLKELKGFKVGQDYAGGIVAFFDRSKLFAGIVANDILPDNLVYFDALKACDNFSSGGYNDWSLPSAYEIMLTKEILKEDVFYRYKEDKNHFWCRENVLLNAYYGMTVSSRKRLNKKASVRPIRFAAI